MVNIIRISDELKRRIDALSKEKGLSQSEAADALLDGTSDMSQQATSTASELPPVKETTEEAPTVEKPKVSQYTPPSAPKERERIQLDDGSEYVACIQGAIDKDATEFTTENGHWTPRIVWGLPSKCPWLTNNPQMSDATVKDQFCRKTPQAGGCQILEHYQRMQVVETLAITKVGIARERLESGSDKPTPKPQLPRDAYSREGAYSRGALPEGRKTKQEMDAEFNERVRTEDNYELWKKKRESGV